VPYDKSLVKRDEHGHFLKGNPPGPAVEMRRETGRGPSTHHLTKAIRDAFEMRIETADNLDYNNRIRRKRKDVMADALAQIISTGECQLPDYRGKDGEWHKGKHFTFDADAWVTHLIKLVRLLEPPVTQVDLGEGMKGIVFDMPIPHQDDEDDEDEVAVVDVDFSEEDKLLND
jgi:hypothetical protein